MARSDGEEDPTNWYSTPPKLSFRGAPGPEPPAGSATPPLHLPGSIPFLWEEAPGRPKKERASPQQQRLCCRRRSLELPPRMVLAADQEYYYSPTTVLDGPDDAKTSSLAACYSFAYYHGHEERPVKSTRERKIREITNNDGGGGVAGLDGGGERGAAPELEGESKVRITARFRSTRKRSVLSLRTNSHLWTDIYESLKQVVSGRRARKTQV